MRPRSVKKPRQDRGIRQSGVMSFARGMGWNASTRPKRQRKIRCGQAISRIKGRPSGDKMCRPCPPRSSAIASGIDRANADFGACKYIRTRPEARGTARGHDADDGTRAEVWPARQHRGGVRVEYLSAFGDTFPFTILRRRLAIHTTPPLSRLSQRPKSRWRPKFQSTPPSGIITPPTCRPS